MFSRAATAGGGATAPLRAVAARVRSRIALWIVPVLLVAACGEPNMPPAAVEILKTPIAADRVASWVPVFAPSVRVVRADDGRPGGATCRHLPPTGLSVGSRRESDERAALARRCDDLYQLGMEESTAYLIRTRWFEREGARRGVKVSTREATQAVRRRVRRLGGSEGLRRYLSTARMSQDQFRSRVRRDLLVRKLLVVIGGPDTSVSRADISRAYRRRSTEYRVPRTRDLRVVVTRSRSDAAHARNTLQMGAHWAKVVRKFSVDASRRSGGHVSIDTHNVLKGLRTRVFSAPLGQIKGPIHVKGYWWIFLVDRERPARLLSLAEATPRIRIAIRSTREQLALDRLMAYLSRHYRPHTVCREGFTAPECRNRPGPVPVR